MAVLTFPNIDPEIVEFGIRYNTQISTTTLSGLVNTVELPGARWAGRLSFSQMEPSESAPLKSFLLQLRGSAGRFFFGDPTQPSPQQTVTGSPTIASGSTRTLIRVTLGSGQFTEGDYLQIGTDDNRELKMVIDSTLVSGSTYDLLIEPAIRRETFIGQSVVYTNPTAQMMLSSSDQATWSTTGKLLLNDINIDFVEAYS